jgi:hypothetical protein
VNMGAVVTRDVERGEQVRQDGSRRAH